ncbi:putative superfamily III holin-X [Kribbella amoyensis]|uniref:Putative superfamily III holin-X n=1 Tax=Kribbella amoyensis TaxID=996641 RepID=A0A561BQU5_9ACTN|nr:phage holin family protein [Kribbella amoyensis]TWD81258.1 putative superfamily III holin-X [Kribbella amoyensis]
MTTHPDAARQNGRTSGQDEHIGALVAQLTNDVSRLVRDELQLAKSELKEKEAGVGVGLFGGAGTVAIYGLGALIAAGILGLATAVPAWLSALIVAVVLFAVAGVAALLGKRHVTQATPPVPQRAVEGVHEDLEALKGHQPEGKITA